MPNRTDNPNDNFGRVIDQPWINYAESPIDVARFEYGYDRDSIVSYRRDTVAYALSGHHLAQLPLPMQEDSTHV